MRITREQLRRIIREEKAKLEETGAIGKAMSKISSHVLQNPDEWNDDPSVQALTDAAAAAKAAGVPVGVMVDAVKRGAR